MAGLLKFLTHRSAPAFRLQKTQNWGVLEELGQNKTLHALDHFSLEKGFGSVFLMHLLCNASAHRGPKRCADHNTPLQKTVGKTKTNCPPTEAQLSNCSFAAKLDICTMSKCLWHTYTALVCAHRNMWIDDVNLLREPVLIQIVLELPLAGRGSLSKSVARHRWDLGRAKLDRGCSEELQTDAQCSVLTCCTDFETSSRVDTSICRQCC